MSDAGKPRRQTASVPRAVGAIWTETVRRQDSGVGLRQGPALDARAAVVDGALGDVVRLDHALVVAVGRVLAADVPPARLLDDVGVRQARAALERAVVGRSEEALGDAVWLGR